tara:strand:- start:775 stop:1932 length:1158 start_codon:yes stop_codon:yes gene_type:complete
MKLSEFKTINTIIERDSKDTTYKFALLRSVIEIIQEYSHLRKEHEDKIIFPLGLLIEKWLLYYYPIISSRIFLPQKNGETSELTPGNKIKFRKQFKTITDFYSDKGGFSVFYRDYKSGSISDEIKPTFIKLLKTLRETITKMPMKYLGNSVFNENYSVFQFNQDHKRIGTVGNQEIDPEFLINSFGSFSFGKQLFTVLEYLGSFIIGVDSILFKWSEFTAKADRSGKLSVEKVFSYLQEYPQTERDVAFARNVYKNLLDHNKHIECVWSDEPIGQIQIMNIDHMIPFAVWRNNDLWNLLPTHKDINLKKRDKIPSSDLLDERKEAIFFYWEKLKEHYEEMFEKEIRLSLLDRSITTVHWQKDCFHQLKNKCKYLINIRGLEEWNI